MIAAIVVAIVALAAVLYSLDQKSMSQTQTAAGVVIGAEGPNASTVDHFTLRTDAGGVIQFVVGRLDLSNGGLPAPHLREHLVSGVAITVYYTAVDGANVAQRYTDAPGGPASSAPTASPELTAAIGPGDTPTPNPSPSPTTAPTPSPTTVGNPAFDVALSAELVVDGLPALTLVTNAGDGSGRLYAVGQNGVISVISPEFDVQAAPFLNIDARVRSGGEQGLLGLAFHPDYASNGRFFVNYTDNDGDTVVSEFTRSIASSGLTLADPASQRVLLTIDQPFANHNGGMIAFGPDGYLYIGMGDGGSGGDPQGNGQAMTTLLGKMLRIDVDSGDLYGIPADNPFVGGTALPEIWSSGLRNPWRFTFDRQTGAMFIGDVGQGAREEVDAEPAGAGGRNYGWNIMEGDICYRTDACDPTGLTPPVAVNDRSGGECAVTGGYVYRGALYPDLVGAYVFSDYCSGTLWAIDSNSALTSGAAKTFTIGEAGFGPSSFGEDEAGELYLVNLLGEIYRLVATPR